MLSDKVILNQLVNKLVNIKKQAVNEPASIDHAYSDSVRSIENAESTNQRMVEIVKPYTFDGHTYKRTDYVVKGKPVDGLSDMDIDWATPDYGIDNGFGDVADKDLTKENAWRDRGFIEGESAKYNYNCKGLTYNTLNKYLTSVINYVKTLI